MIHVIYLYIIFNAFVSGAALFGYQNTWWKNLLLTLFGLPMCLGYGIWLLAHKIDVLLEVRTLLSLIFTDNLRKWSEPDSADSLRKWYPKMNTYKRWVLRQIARKYSIDLTKNK